METIIEAGRTEENNWRDLWRYPTCPPFNVATFRERISGLFNPREGIRCHEERSSPRGQTIGKLREAEVELARGKTVPEMVRKLGVTEQTYCRWKREYGGLRPYQAKRLKELEKETLA